MQLLSEEGLKGAPPFGQARTGQPRHDPGNVPLTGSWPALRAGAGGPDAPRLGVGIAARGSYQAGRERCTRLGLNGLCVFAETAGGFTVALLARWARSPRGATRTDKGPPRMP